MGEADQDSLRGFRQTQVKAVPTKSAKTPPDHVVLDFPCPKIRRPNGICGAIEPRVIELDDDPNQFLLAQDNLLVAKIRCRKN